MLRRSVNSAEPPPHFLQVSPLVLDWFATAGRYRNRSSGSACGLHREPGRTMTMQRDMKVGMAVGVALIGIVGALFFRREPETKDKEAPPPLQNTADLDRRIAEKGKAPYIDGVEELSEHAAPGPAAQNASSKPASKSANADPPRFLTSAE